MTKYYNILKGIVSFLSFLVFISLLIAIIYYFADYKTNNELNLYIDDYTMPYIIVFAIVFLVISIFFGIMHLKEIKNKKKSNI